MEAIKRVVLVGGGHCNCQVIKQMKQVLPPSTKLTLVSETSTAYYSGMLPGSAAGLYKNEQIQVHLKPLATYCNADFIEKRVAKVSGNENKLYFEDGETLDYDVLCLNVGSKTRDGH